MKRVYVIRERKGTFEFTFILVQKSQDYVKLAEEAIEAHRTKISLVHEDDVQKVWNAVSPEFRAGISKLEKLPNNRAGRILVL